MKALVIFMTICILYLTGLNTHVVYISIVFNMLMKWYPIFIMFDMYIEHELGHADQRDRKQ